MIKGICVILLVYAFKLLNGILINPPPYAKHSLIVALANPLNLENEAISYGWVFRAQYYLPESVNELKGTYYPFRNSSVIRPPDKLKQWSFPNENVTRNRRELLVDSYTGQKYEKYDAEVTEIGNEKLEDSSDDLVFDDEIDNIDMIPNLNSYGMEVETENSDTSGARWLLYDGFGALLSKKGIEGRYCMLRSICEANEFNFGYHNGLFGQLFYLFFTPSSTDDPIINKVHYDYVKAEILGKSGEPCDKIFHQCKFSILDIFTKIYEIDSY